MKWFSSLLMGFFSEVNKEKGNTSWGDTWENVILSMSGKHTQEILKYMDF